MRKTSILQDKTKVTEAVKKSNTTREALHHLGLRSAGGNYKAFKEACVRYGLIQPIGTGTPAQTSAMHRANLIPLEEILVEESSYTNRSMLKKRCFAEGLLINKCYICSQPPQWQNFPLTLQLDHINGIWNDNRIENLRILCPNCHTQTASYSGRSSRLAS